MNRLPLFLALALFTCSAHAADAAPAPAEAVWPFRLLFRDYKGKKDKPEQMTFQILTIDIKQAQPPEFLKFGEFITKTRWKIVKFEYKEINNPNAAEIEDVSELSIVNRDTKRAAVLILNHVRDLAVIPAEPVKLTPREAPQAPR